VLEWHSKFGTACERCNAYAEEMQRLTGRDATPERERCDG